MSRASIIPDDSTGAGLDLDLSGRLLGDYRLLRRLGRGAMADVYLAEQGSLRRQVAFKVLKRELAADATYVRRFHMEAQAAAALVHANIVQIYEVGCVDGVHYIAQEYVEGQNLGQLMARRGTPDVSLAAAIVRQVASALCKAAERGIVHRDIKPENIMLGRSGEVKVADFGLARVTAADESMKLTQVGVTMGTPLYMSPEQVEGRSLDPRSDLYSLGVTCYHMLAGKPPFRGETALSVALQHVRSQPERLENVRADLPPALGRIVHKMLAKDPAERYQHPRELLRELRELATQGGDFQWPQEMDEFDTVEIASLATRGEATQRLQVLMDHQADVPSAARWMWLAAMAACIALVLGALAAWSLREPFILDRGSSAPLIMKFDTPLEQYNFARLNRSPEAWQAVTEGNRFPPDNQYVVMAKQELAELYLHQSDKKDRDEAMKLFTEFANAPVMEKQQRAFGIAGQAIVLSIEGKPEESSQKLAELIAIVSDLDSGQVRRYLDPYMAQALGDVLRKNREQLKSADAAKLESLLQDTSVDEAEQ